MHAFRRGCGARLTLAAPQKKLFELYLRNDYFNFKGTERQIVL